MALKTPDWILEGYDSKSDWAKKNPEKAAVQSIEKPKNKKGKKKSKKSKSRDEDLSKKKFKVRRCPKCDSDEVKVVVERDAKGDWECKECGWTGKKPNMEELTEEEFMKYLDEKGEEVA